MFRINKVRRKSNCPFEINICVGTADSTVHLCWYSGQHYRFVLVQRTALSISTGRWTDNISNNLHSDYKNSLVCL